MREIVLRMSNLMITLPVLALPLMAWAPQPAMAGAGAIELAWVSKMTSRSGTTLVAVTKGIAELTGH